MTLIIELEPDVQERLERAAAARGISADEYAKRLLVDYAPRAASSYENRSPQERARAVREWAESHRRLDAEIPDEALDRDSLYEGRGG